MLIYIKNMKVINIKIFIIHKKDQINVFNISLYIVKNNHYSTTKMKLNKMIYYAHTKHLVQTKKPLVKEQTQAWIYGPVFTELCTQLKEFTYKPLNLRFFINGR